MADNNNDDSNDDSNVIRNVDKDNDEMSCVTIPLSNVSKEMKKQVRCCYVFFCPVFAKTRLVLERVL